MMEKRHFMPLLIKVKMPIPFINRNHKFCSIESYFFGCCFMNISIFLDNAKITETLIRNGASMTVTDNDGNSVLSMSLRYINKGLTTIWYGVREMFHSTLKIISNPTEAIQKSHIKSVNIGNVKFSFDSDTSSSTDSSDQFDSNWIKSNWPRVTVF